MKYRNPYGGTEPRARILDIGAGWLPYMWLPGAIVSECNFDSDDWEDPNEIPPEITGQDLSMFEDESLDAITSFDAFRHVYMNEEELVGRFVEYSRVLKPSGAFIVFDHCESCIGGSSCPRVSPTKLELVWRRAANTARREGGMLEIEHALFTRREMAVLMRKIYVEKEDTCRST